MIFLNKQFSWFISFASVFVATNTYNTGESGVRKFLEHLNEKSAKMALKLVNAQWEFETNTSENAKNELITSDTLENAKQRFRSIVNNYPWRSFSNPDIRRQLKLFSEIDVLALPLEDYLQFEKIISDLDLIQQNTTICDYHNKTKCDLHLDPEIKEKLETSQNITELWYLWTEWRNAIEPKLEKLLKKYVKLCNKAATLNNYTNFQEYLLRNFEVEDIKREMTSLWKEVQPLYQQIHAYVRKKLRDFYGAKKVPFKGPIPAYLLGNIWSENWLGIAYRFVPFPEKDNLNFTSAMISQGYTSELIHHLAEDLFASMNFSKPSHVWFNYNLEASHYKKTKNCRSKIFNFYNKNIRIIDCRKVSLKNYLIANRLMAKAEYMLQYSHQPYIYQNPADPGLEAAINNIITMSASTFKNLKQLGLYENTITEEVRLNRLFKMALEKITTIPFLLVQEYWRWDIYSGKPLEYTKCSVNNLREKFQGISTYTNEFSFDPSGIGSVFSKSSLMHHFLGYFLEFQIYEFLCQISEQSQRKNELLDECNLFQNIKAGIALRNLMKLGSSKPLSEAIKSILEQKKINSKSLLKYFEPLMNWLKKENERTGEFIGWKESEHSKEICPKITRKKRSLEDYPAESKDDDTDNLQSSREPDRYQSLMEKKIKDYVEQSKISERERKNTENVQNRYEKNSLKNKNILIENDKQRRNADKSIRGLLYSKKRSVMKNNKDGQENSENSVAEEEKENTREQNSNKVMPKNKKRHIESEFYEQAYNAPKTYVKNLKIKEENIYRKRRNGNEPDKNYETIANGNKVNSNAVSNNNIRYARKVRKNQKRFDSEVYSQNHEILREKDQNRNQYQLQQNRPSRDAQWHTNNKKDISRLLHSFGFAVENDDKEKIKDLKKKLKGDSNSDLKSNIASKENFFEGMIDYNRVKSGDKRTDSDEKGTNKLWSVKSYMTNNAKILQSNPSLNKKESSHLAGSMIAHASEEKSERKKETFSNNKANLAPLNRERISEVPDTHLSQKSESRQLNIDVPSLQALLKTSDLISYGQKPMITSDMSDTKAKTDLNHMLNVKTFPNKYGYYLYKYVPNEEKLPYKDKKEYRDDADTGNKSPYIIILGQTTPDMKEHLIQEKETAFVEADKQPQLRDGFNGEEKKMLDKRSRASEQIFIVPIDLKNSQHNPMKSNHFTERDREVDHDPNTERDQKSEEEQLHLEDNPKLEGKSDLYKNGKDSSSEFIISWNNNKNSKIVKRSKREHKKETRNEKLKVVRIAPIKESVLEGLLGSSLDRTNLNDKNVKILIHDGLLNEGTDLSSALAAASYPKESSASLDSSMMDESQSAAIQHSSPLSSIASSVFSALSPKSYSQVAKAASQHQDAEQEDDNLKENSAVEAFGEKEHKTQEFPFLANPSLRCNALPEKKKGAKLFSDEEAKKLIDVDPAAKGDSACCKKIILTPCPPKCPSPLPTPIPNPCICPIPCPPPCPTPCPEPECCKKMELLPECCKPETDLCCKKPSECSLVNCQFKITKAKKPHERLTIMIYDRINPPAELPEPYDALAVISEILQRIQCCSCKPSCQLTEEDPDYPSNDNTDQLKQNLNQPQDNKAKVQELNEEIPILVNDNPEEEESDDISQKAQNSRNSADEDNYQSKEKATPAIDQLTVFNKDKLKPVFIELRKIDDIINKRSQQK